MDQQIFVYVDLDGTSHLVGRLWQHNRKRVESATFRYDEEWLRNPARFPLEPALQMDAAPHHTTAGKSLFGAIGDSAPDRWGRALMMRAEARRARNDGEPSRTLWEADYLLLVDDETRQGALRFAAQEGGPFLRGVAEARVQIHISQIFAYNLGMASHNQYLNVLVSARGKPFLLYTAMFSRTSFSLNLSLHAHVDSG